MECYYHPERESTDNCAICGKSICKECGLEIAGKTYCKECLEKIVGIGINNKSENIVSNDPIKSQPARLNKQPKNNEIYQPRNEVDEYEMQAYSQEVQNKKPIRDDSPYNIKNNYSRDYNNENNYSQIEQKPQIAQNEFDYYPENKVTSQRINDSQNYIYPDHSYEPQETSARQDLEDKYEKYLDDLYFDENEIPLDEQLAKDEAQYGSLTRRQYHPRKEEAKPFNEISRQKKPPKNETPDEMEARIRAELAKEQNLINENKNSIHNINYKEEKEPMSAVDIILTIILVIIVLIVIYYIIYLFLLSSNYPTFMDAIFALTNPQNVINNLLSGN